MAAVWNNNIGEINTLIKNGADVHYDNNEAMCISVKIGQLEIIKILINNGVDIRCNNNYALIKSASFGHLDIIKFLITLDFDIDEKNSALSSSVRNGHFDIATFLIENGADIHHKKESMLRHNASYNNLEAVKFLIENSAVITKNDNEALCDCAYKGHVEIVKLLINNGALNAESSVALKNSIEYGYLEIVKLLVENGVNAADQLYRSIRYGHLEIFHYLFELDNEEDCISLLKYCLSKNVYDGQIKIAKYLVQFGNIHFDNNTFLNYEKIFENLTVVKFLAESCNKEFLDHMLSYFTKHYNSNVCIFLIENGANIYLNDHIILRTNIKLSFKDVLISLLPRYNLENLKIVLNKTKYRNRLIPFLLKQDLSKYLKVVQVYREFGIDLFDMIENEK